MTEPTDQLATYQSTDRLLAGKITEVCKAGCYVENADGTTIFRAYLPQMTDRYKPVVGDYWAIHLPEDGYQSIIQKAAFDDGCALVQEETTASPDRVDSASDARVVNNVMRHEYRVLSDAEKAAMKNIKDIGLTFIEACDALGNSRELSLAKTNAEQAVMWAVKHLTAQEGKSMNPNQGESADQEATGRASVMSRAPTYAEIARDLDSVGCKYAGDSREYCVIKAAARSLYDVDSEIRRLSAERDHYMRLAELERDHNRLAMLALTGR